MRYDFVPIRSVANDEHLLLLESVHDEIVENHASVVAADRVERTPDGELRDIVGDEPVDLRDGVGSFDQNFAHVGDVEEPCPRTHRFVLGLDAFVLHGHEPAGKGDQPRAQRTMLIG
jgi:hypothetical protein